MDPPLKKMCLGTDSERASGMSETEKMEVEDLIPRDYQIELLEYAKKHNTIACLGTGTGKTFIAVLLIREMSNLTNKHSRNGGKLIFFIVPTVPLVHQQCRVIGEYTELNVGKYFGEMNVDTWNKHQWEIEFSKNHVLVMTAEIGRIILDHSFLSPTKICLLIMDECHQAKGKSPYREIMKNIHSCPQEKRPRIFGLSASLLNGKCKPLSLENTIHELEMTMLSTIETASDYNDVQKYGTDPDEYLVVYNQTKDSCSVFSNVLKDMDNLQQELSSLISSYSTRSDASNELSNVSSYASDDICFFDQPKKCLRHVKEIFNDLGPFCAYHAVQCFNSELLRILQRSDDQEHITMLKRVKCLFDEFFHVYESLGYTIAHDLEEGTSVHKLKKLLQIFDALKRSESFQKLIAKPSDMQQISSDIRSSVDPKNNESRCELPLCGIVFVQQRITAYVLCKWMNAVSDHFTEFKFLKANFIVGHSSRGASSGEKESIMSVKKQTQVVKAFRKSEFNILVATSVLEEGMDIRQCNIVLRFDLPKDFRSYVQSKGRARAKNSKYVVMVPQEDLDSFLEDLCNFKTIEDLLMKRCHDRQMPSEEEIGDHMDDNLLPPYLSNPDMEGSPRITMNNSVSLINRYCCKLPCDMAARLTPSWKIVDVDPDSKETEYICTLQLPINCPLREPVVGAPMRRKKLAKMAAALKACELLHKLGELNDHLLPISEAVDNAADELGVVKAENDIQLGTHRRRKYYKKRIANDLKNCQSFLEGIPYYLHVLEMDLVVPLAKSLNPRDRPLVNPAHFSQGFGFLSQSILPKVSKFPIFTKCGKILINIKKNDVPIYLGQKEVAHLWMFHKFVISDTLSLESENVNFNPTEAEFSCVIVPVNKNSDSSFSLDWKCVTNTLHHDYQAEKLKPMKELQKPVYQKSVFFDAVVTCSYLKDCWSFEKPVFYYVNKIREDLSPASIMDDFKSSANEKVTYSEFVHRRRNVEVQYQNQPLLEVERCPTFNLSKPMYTTSNQAHFDDSSAKSNTKLKHRNFKEFLIPELCIVHPFSAQLFRQATYLPTIFYRLNQLLLGEQVRCSVASSEHVGMECLTSNFQWPVFNFEKSDQTLRKKLLSLDEIISEDYSCMKVSRDILKYDDIESFEVRIDVQKVPGPSPGQLLQAFTTKSAGDEFNLERLETIGDSFLKYAISVKLYSKYPLFDEGKLTQLRSKIICNKNLYLLSEKKDLPEFLVNSPFICENSWLPPCYTTMENESKKSKREANDKTMQLISDKCIADSIEAVIGTYLLSCGYRGALGFMCWIGLSPFAENEYESNVAAECTWPPSVASPIILECANVQQRIEHLTGGFDRFEKRINYKFKEPAYLLQAFTHASYSSNHITDCYQRLEFLGDAVLDYLITRKLYDDPAEHSPGELTDLRSALVNNIYFASLAVKYGFHKNLKVLSITLLKLISQYIGLLQNSEAFKEFEKYGFFLEEIECFELEEVECPKALGDVFESVAGAVYLDSGMSLDTVWKVFYPMMKPAIDHLCQHVPKSPVRQLYERVPAKDIFKCGQEKDGKSYVTAYLPDGKEFVGTGPNKKVAKRSAAKRALRYLNEM